MGKNDSDKFDRDPGTILYSWDPRGGKRVIISRSKSYGRRFHIRTWMLNSKGAYYPTRAGITLGIVELKKLRRALKKIAKKFEGS